MKVLVLGGGGREHALAWKLRQSPQVEAVFALPGSDGVAAGGVACLAGDPCAAAGVLRAVRERAVDLVVVGPEAPLAAGIADALRAAGVAVFGPSRAAAQLESSKIFAKEFMARHHIPTARFAAASGAVEARRALAAMGPAVVIKADGLAAGKGVVVPETAAEADRALEQMLAGELAGAAGERVVIEERLRGPEVSLLAISNGESYLLLSAARDHKRLLDGDRGPNTGGMGAISFDALLADAVRQEVEEKIVRPTLAGMAKEGAIFQGVLYCGLMLTPQGPKVLEYNVRFGDPEAQAILPRWGGDIAGVLQAAARGEDMAGRAGAALAPASACVVAASGGYPGGYLKGEAIAGLDAAGQHPGVTVFHAGTRRGAQGWETNGGRVLAVAATGDTLAAALAPCYQALQNIQFRGMQFRRDIGASSAHS
ncbi:MAG: phosphoribosylamine--glycine ligase [Terriglobales bacterium]